MGKKKDNQIIVRIICVIASFILWLYIANVENPERTTTLTVPVTILNADTLADSRLILLNDRTFQVKIKVKGPMLDINALDSSKLSVKADLSAYVIMLKKGINRIPVSITAPDNIAVMDQENLRLEINLDALKDKNVPVTVDVPATTKSGFTALKPILDINSVTVSGPEQYVQNVTYVSAKTEIKDADSDKEFNLQLQAYDEAGRVVKNVKIYPENVNVMIPVKKTKTVSISVNIKGNISKNLRLNSYEAVPSKIQIAGDDNTLKNISQIQTEAIDLSAITGSKTVEAKLEIPSNVTVVQGSSTVNVKFDIDPIGQRNISKSIQFINLGQGLNYTSDKSDAFVVLTGPQSVLNSIKDSDIQCTADLSNLGEGENHNVPINVSGVPAGITIQSKNPQTAKVTITKTPETTTTTQNQNQTTTKQ